MCIALHRILCDLTDHVTLLIVNNTSLFSLPPVDVCLSALVATICHLEERISWYVRGESFR